MNVLLVHQQSLKFTSSFDFHALVHNQMCQLMSSSPVLVQSGPSAPTPSMRRGTRGGRRLLQTGERCGRPSCNNRVNLRGETQKLNVLTVVDQTLFIHLMQKSEQLFVLGVELTSLMTLEESKTNAGLLCLF